MAEPIDPQPSGAADEFGSIAIVGMAGRWPDAPDIETFWRNMAAGHHSTRPVPDDKYRAAGGDEAGLTDPNRIRLASTIDGIELFDADFFDCVPGEAQLIDPQQRMFLEVCHHALEHAGYDPARGGGQIGVYAGVSQSEYFLDHIHPRYGDAPGSLELLAAKAGNVPDALTMRVSYKLGLTGPSVCVQTTCSTSLVAVHMACQELLNFRCDTALAGGSSLNPLAYRGYRYVEQGILSPDGHTRAFDADARGTIRGDAVAAVVLRRLEDALADGDRIWAVIRGSAVNNDGTRKPAFSAPSPQGQTDVIREAIAAADVPADTLTYVEAHGTGTPVGDPIEVAALTAAFRERSDRTGFCALGSVKSNVGHTDTAAGVTGLIKVVLSMRNRRIPGTVGFRTPNPAIDFPATPFRVHGETIDWEPAPGAPLRAGVSAFGVGGTNAHVIVEEPPRPEPRAGDDGSWQLLRLSARTPEALDRLAAGLADRLAGEQVPPLADVAHTLRVGRRELPYRRTVVCRDAVEAAEALRHPGAAAGPVPAEGRRTAFLLPGGGAQYPGMGAGLYRSEPVFRDAMDRASAALRPLLGHELTELLYHRATADGPCEVPFDFPALVAVEHALAALLAEQGVRPSVLLGHSLGEYTAAVLSGVMSLEDALGLVSLRERLMLRAGGATLSVWLGEAALRPYLADGLALDLATVNSPGACTVSGTEEAVSEMERRLTADGVECSRVRLAAAPHSRLLDPVLEEFATAVRAVALSAPAIPYVANLTGTWITAEQATDPAYWVRHMRGTVRFADGLAALAEAGDPVLLECGPGRTLAGYAVGRSGAPATVLPAMRHAKADQVDDGQALWEAVGGLWALGVAAAPRTSPGDARRVPLPGYPFARTRHWIERAARGSAEPVAAPPASRGFPVNLAAEDAALRAAEERLRASLPVDEVPVEVRELLDRLCALHVTAYLRSQGVSTEPGAVHDRAGIHRALRTVPAYRKFVDALLHLLEVDGIAESEEGRLRFTGDAGDDEEIAKIERTIRENHPEYVAELELVEHCRARYGQVVGGEVAGTEVLLPDGRSDISRPVAEKWVAASDIGVYRDLIAETVARLAARVPGRPVRILEVGGGQGGVTWTVAEALREVPRVEYRFTDLGRAFVLGAQRRAEHEGLHHMTFGTLDISRDPAGQDVETGAWDMVIAYNVLHATPDLRATLRNVHGLLAPGGALFLLEACREPRFAVATAGLFEGWWFFEDGLREDTPLVTPGVWRDLLAETGFGNVASYPEVPQEKSFTAHALIVGQRPADQDTVPANPVPASPVAASPLPATGGATFNRRPALAQPYAEPRTDLERRVAAHWQEVLGVEPVGVEDGFFDLGGDSLLALQLVTRLRDELKVELSVKRLLERLTVAAVAQDIEAGASRSADGPAVIRRSARRDTARHQG
ncbi:acyltransferase domain-containing protein [Streptomyces sp. NA02950]|uniref:type I polyketide synthase n=1 Tax=Streptomyces sp. NA02950 TaxID=2742137 RepID=UPI001590F167|nr:type I polyketide synthase [Streptomyces sp. NA02950]QKV96263.1 acyltransferase domain-containing protein [Streptomyces sp. NA02950]